MCNVSELIASSVFPRYVLVFCHIMTACRVLQQYFSTAGPRPGTGPWHQFYRATRPKETAIYYKISLVQLITNLNVILYLSTCHTVYISVLILL